MTFCFLLLVSIDAHFLVGDDSAPSRAHLQVGDDSEFFPMIRRRRTQKEASESSTKHNPLNPGQSSNSTKKRSKYAKGVLMSEDEKDLLDDVLSKGANYFEFGVGNSTLFASEHTNLLSITAVSSNGELLDKLQKTLPRDVQHGRVRFKHRLVGQTEDRSKGLAGTPVADAGRLYSEAIIGANPVPDVVLIDGRYRDACLLQTTLTALQEHWPQVHIMIHDYHRWKYQENAKAVLGKPTRVAGYRKEIQEKCKRDHAACSGAEQGGCLAEWFLDGEKLASMRQNTALLAELNERLHGAENVVD